MDVRDVLEGDVVVIERVIKLCPEADVLKGAPSWVTAAATGVNEPK
ncbi:MAG: hypothetical protein LYZ66_07055 [Nitrososphaerales archaeon]|nr:hypothetical protein [Nitrososphaerales archaeon]